MDHGNHGGHEHHAHGAAMQHDMQQGQDPLNVTHLFNAAVNTAVNITTTTILPIINSTVNHHMHHNHNDMNDDSMAMMDHGQHAPAPAAHENHNLHTSAQDHTQHQSHSMKMFFNCDTSGIVVLFDFWRIDSPLALLGSMLILFALAVAYEGLKIGREVLLSKMQKTSIRQSSKSRRDAAEKCETILLKNGCCEDKIETDIVSPGQCTCGVCDTCKPLPSGYWRSFGHVVQSVLHVVQVVLSYCLMLVFMTYNVWLCLAVSLGAGVGYFAFAWRRRTLVDTTEHCN